MTGIESCIIVGLGRTVELRSLPSKSKRAKTFSFFSAPPSYSEAFGDGSEMQKDDDDDNTNGNWDYKPRYMTYHSREG